MQLAADGVRIWFWARENITSDVTDGVPDPNLWGVPEVEFRSTDKCSVSSHWRKQTIVRCPSTDRVVSPWFSFRFL